MQDIEVTIAHFRFLGLNFQLILEDVEIINEIELISKVGARSDDEVILDLKINCLRKLKSFDLGLKKDHIGFCDSN
jgi:hypothetical protein